MVGAIALTNSARLKVAIGCGVAALIAWVAPFDLAFDAATFGVPAVRSALIVLLALVGVALSSRVGLGIEPRGPMKYPILTPVMIAAATAVYCAICDASMRSELSPRFLDVTLGIPVGWRIILFAARAINENIIYRLFLGTALIWALGLVWRDDRGRPAAGAYFIGFTVAQVVNIWINVTAHAPLTPSHLLHDGLRYVVPGLVWSWLYWKHGFQSNEIACTTVHLFLQPIATIGLA
jgi:hypothetical protein